MKSLQYFWAAGAICAVVMLSPKAANAGLAEFEALQSANAGLVFQYGFEGADDSTRLADGSANGYTLQRTVGANGGDVNDIQFVAGFDGASRAYQPSFDTTSYRIGAGLNSISTTIPIAAAVTIEAVLQLDSFVQPVDNTSGAYILSARPQPGNGRAYFLRQMNDAGGVRLTSTLGDTFADVPSVLSYVPGDWYYLAMEASYDSGLNQTTVSWYGANLSQLDSLSLIAFDDTTFQGLWDGDAQIGIGNFLNGSQEFMQGRIDNIALTTGLLDTPDLESRLAALYIPEPSTFALAMLGTLALVARRMKR